jgi:hypothetical protein
MIEGSGFGSGTLVPVHPDLDSLNPVRDMDLGFWLDPDPDPVPGVHEQKLYSKKFGFFCFKTLYVFADLHRGRINSEKLPSRQKALQTSKPFSFFCSVRDQWHFGRIRIRGSVPLTNGPRSGSDSFVQ